MINPSNVECDDIIEWLDDYRRHKLEPHLRVIVSEHLAQCDHCTEELRLRDSLGTHLASSLADQPAAPSVLTPRVLHAIATTNPGANARKSPQMLPWMLTGAAVVLISVAVLQTEFFDSTSPAVELASVSTERRAEMLAAQTAPASKPDTLMEAESESSVFSRQMQAKDTDASAMKSDAPAQDAIPPPSATPASSQIPASADAPAATIPARRTLGYAQPASAVVTTATAEATTGTQTTTATLARQEAATTASALNTTVPVAPPPPQPE